MEENIRRMFINVASCIAISLVAYSNGVFSDTQAQISWYYGKYGEELVNQQNFGENIDDFEGDYHFGESEMESDISIRRDGNAYSLAHSEMDWDGEKFVTKYTREDLLISEQSRFDVDGWQGEFIYYYDQYINKNPNSDKVLKASPIHKLKGLIIYTSPVGIRNELGIDIIPHGEQPELAGDYPFASYRLLTYDDIKDKPKTELRLMRNEIFARYGYIFKPGGEMDKHFSAQDWYTPRFNDVTDFISDIEKDNIRFIQENE